MLEVQDLHAYYGKSHILQGVDMYVDAGEVECLDGWLRNALRCPALHRARLCP
jgi:ABC-type branched-subunit amino acid transport system ATPase component